MLGHTASPILIAAQYFDPNKASQREDVTGTRPVHDLSRRATHAHSPQIMRPLGGIWTNLCFESARKASQMREISKQAMFLLVIQPYFPRPPRALVTFRLPSSKRCNTLNVLVGYTILRVKKLFIAVPLHVRRHLQWNCNL